MASPTNNIHNHQTTFILDQVKSIHVLNYIYHYINQAIQSIDNESYIINIIYEYDFYNTFLLNYDFDHENIYGIMDYFMILSTIAKRIHIILFAFDMIFYYCIKLTNYGYFCLNFMLLEIECYCNLNLNITNIIRQYHSDIFTVQDSYVFRRILHCINSINDASTTDQGFNITWTAFVSCCNCTF